MNVLFICLGNICRSPMAEGLFRHHIEKYGVSNQFKIDSCGTGAWHVGALPDKRMCQTALNQGIRLTHKARQIQKNDFINFDHLLVMDHQNYEDVVKLNPSNKDKVSLITKFSESYFGEIIPDPYFGDLKDFENVFHILNQVTFELSKHFNK